MTARPKKSAGAGPTGPATARAAKAAAAAGPTRGGPNRIVIATVVAILAIVGIVAGTIWMNRAGSDRTGQGTATPAGTAMGEGYRVAATVSPAPGAPKVDVYEDFQCPYCAIFEKAVGGVLPAMAARGEIELRYHVMSFLDEKSSGAYSTKAGNAAFCAAAGGGGTAGGGGEKAFQHVHDGLFDSQPAVEGDGWTDDQLTGLASGAGLGAAALETWKTCVANGTYTAYLTAVTKNGFGVPKFPGTPSIYVNGTNIGGAELTTPEALRAAIAKATG